MKTLLDILIKPVLSEKMTSQEAKLNSYGFIVQKSANKVQIKKAIEEMYGVIVESINTMRYAGKNKSRFTKTGYIAGKSNSYKKAIVTVKQGDKIDFFSNI